MKLLKHILLLTLFAFILYPAYPQEDARQDVANRQRLGIQYYQNQEFDKCLEIFTELYREQPNHTNYTYAYYSLMELREYREAEKFVKKHARKNSRGKQWKCDLSKCLKWAGAE